MPAYKLLLILNCAPAPVEFESRAEFEITQVAIAAEAEATLRSGGIDCVLVIGSSPACCSMDLLETLSGADPLVPVVFWGDTVPAADVVRLVRNGATNCFGPEETPDTVYQHLEDLCEGHRRKSQRIGRQRAPWAGWFIGESRAMDDVFHTISLVGPRRCTVLITGETGTGKEMAARALHAASPRAHLPMVALNCSAVPENLLEAELFGHVKGAFTGAVAGRQGRFEQAHRSTLFLDEIGEMPLEVQAKLLRVLQEREFQRLGGTETIRVDVRVIAASNSDLLAKVRQGRFREDLYYRLNVVPLRMPSLREKRGDIPLLVDHFVEKVCRAEGIPNKTVSPLVKERLSERPWPGNVRQLENLVEATIALSGDRETLTLAGFGLVETSIAPIDTAAGPDTVSTPIDFERAVGQFERSLLEGSPGESSRQQDRGGLDAGPEAHHPDHEAPRIRTTRHTPRRGGLTGAAPCSNWISPHAGNPRFPRVLCSSAVKTARALRVPRCHRPLPQQQLDLHSAHPQSRRDCLHGFSAPVHSQGLGPLGEVHGRGRRGRAGAALIHLPPEELDFLLHACTWPSIAVRARSADLRTAAIWE